MTSYNIAAVIDYFNKRDVEFECTPGIVKLETRYGQFAPSPLAPLEECVQALVRDCVIPPHGPVLDAGAGDGRVTALFGHLGYRACGIEGDQILAGLARKNIRELQTAGLVPPDTAVCPGDFTSRSAYSRLFIAFPDFGIVFNYQSNAELVAALIREESPAGTVFLYAAHHVAHLPFERLEHVQSIAYPPFGREESPIFLHVYKKMAGNEKTRRWVRDARVHERVGV